MNLQPCNFFDEWSICDDIYDDVHRSFAKCYSERPVSVPDLGRGNDRHLTQTPVGRVPNRLSDQRLPRWAFTRAAKLVVSVVSCRCYAKVLAVA